MVYSLYIFLDIVVQESDRWEADKDSFYSTISGALAKQG